jgi:NADH-quinone oxidoreductase subunit J
MEQALFVLFGAVALAGAILAVTSRNAVAAAAWLVVTFFGMAGTFVLLEAYFVAVVQVLVYAGAIMVLFLFVIMLLDLKTDELRAAGRPRLRMAGVVLSALFLVAVLRAIADARDRPDAIAPRASALLRLPPPPAEASPDAGSDPLAEPTRGPAPEPVPVSLSRRDPAWIPVDQALRETLRSTAARPSAEVPEPSGPARVAEVRPQRRTLAGALPVARGFRPLVVLLSRGGPEGETWRATGAWADVDGDGTVEASEALESRAPDDGGPARYDAGLAGAGATLDVSVVQSGLSAAPYGAPDGSPFAIGRSLFEDWILPFEVTSVLLLGAIFGAVVLTKRRLAS